MKYLNALQAIDTLKALQLLGITAYPNGTYAKFSCLECWEDYANIKLFGEKKNVYYCNKCKGAGNILTLTLKVKMLLDYNEAIEFLGRTMTSQKPITEELNLNYELEWNEKLDKAGYTKEICNKFGIGFPKGKTMLSGCIVYTVYNEQGTKIAYYGYRLKDYKPVFLKSFNPELYLYNYHNIDMTKPVYVTNAVKHWLMIFRDVNQNVVALFDLPYLSGRQLKLLREIPEITFFGYEEEINPLIAQADKFLENYILIFKKK